MSTKKKAAKKKSHKVSISVPRFLIVESQYEEDIVYHATLPMVQAYIKEAKEKGQSLMGVQFYQIKQFTPDHILCL